MWLATVGFGPDVPFEQIHVMLYSYFPQVTRGDPRPYVFRLLTRERLAVGSSLRPVAPDARRVSPERGVTYDFRLTFKRVRNIHGSDSRPDGTRRARVPRVVEITDPGEMKTRIARFAAPRGGSVRYVRVENVRLLTTRRFTLPIADAVGKIYVDDAALIDRELLCNGGPSTGKSFGCGMWWLPELMVPADPVRAA
ncbi:MAG: hypothetical protein AB7H90_19060 [Alphaproteobacteria bacterium]